MDAKYGFLIEKCFSDVAQLPIYNQKNCKKVFVKCSNFVVFVFSFYVFSFNYFTRHLKFRHPKKDQYKCDVNLKNKMFSERKMFAAFVRYFLFSSKSLRYILQQC